MRKCSWFLSPLKEGTIHSLGRKTGSQRFHNLQELKQLAKPEFCLNPQTHPLSHNKKIKQKFNKILAMGEWIILVF